MNRDNLIALFLGSPVIALTVFHYGFQWPGHCLFFGQYLKREDIMDMRKFMAPETKKRRITWYLLANSAIFSGQLIA